MNDADKRLLQGEVLRARVQSEDNAAELDNVNDDIFALQGDLDDAEMRLAMAEADVAAVDAKVENLRETVENRSHFLGAFATTAELEAYPMPTNNDYADNYETFTRWYFSTASDPAGEWINSGVEISVNTALLGDAVPVMDGTASAGSARLASRADHRHPSDSSKVNTSRTVNGQPLTSNVELTLDALEFDTAGAVVTVDADGIEIHGGEWTAVISGEESTFDGEVLRLPITGSDTIVIDANAAASAAEIKLDESVTAQLAALDTDVGDLRQRVATLEGGGTGNVALYRHNIRVYVQSGSSSTTMSCCLTIYNNTDARFSIYSLYAFLNAAGYTGGLDTRRVVMYPASGIYSSYNVIGIGIFTNSSEIHVYYWSGSQINYYNFSTTNISVELSDIVTQII